MNNFIPAKYCYMNCCLLSIQFAFTAPLFNWLLKVEGTDPPLCTIRCNWSSYVLATFPKARLFETSVIIRLYVIV